ncbi:MAG: type II secretion system F family protein, partial [Acidimicrobiales bacterium]
MIGLLLALLGGLGVFYIYSAFVFGWTGLAPGPAPAGSARPRGAGLNDWLVQAGLQEVELAQFAAVVVSLFALGATVAFAMFGGLLPALLLGMFMASLPVSAYRVRRLHRRQLSHEAWPHLIEEIKVMTGSAGRSIPQALFEVGARAPEQMRPAFDAAQREWLLTTDFERTLNVLKGRLADPTADITCETLLVAHQVGGTDLDQRLASLAEDRVTDSQGR